MNYIIVNKNYENKGEDYVTMQVDRIAEDSRNLDYTHLDCGLRSVSITQLSC